VIVSNTRGIARLKIINASRGPIHEYGKLRRKLYNCNANIYLTNNVIEKKTHFIYHL